MSIYEVKQGDHLSSIAKTFGFLNFHTIWDDPQNADLKSLRVNPNVLFPGDQLFIPDKTDKTETRSTGATHRFRAPLSKLELRIVTHDINDNPVAGENCTLQVEAEFFKLQTDGDGMIDQKIAADAVNGLFQITQMEIPVKIGFLDPTDTAPGSRERLTNLGYYWGPQDDSDPLSLRSAIEEFQCDHKLPVNGKMDAATQARLEKEHGC
jgi:N-acetylmuramoyl-L-alanine amidase